MSDQPRPVGIWAIIVLLILSIGLMLIGQTLAIFNYELTVKLGLQESPAEVGAYGVQVNRAFGVGDTVVYIPLMVAAIIGLWRKKDWAVVPAAAVFGISVYWTVTCMSMFLLLGGLPEYTFQPGLEIWAYLAVFFLFGCWGLWYFWARDQA